MSIKLKKVVVTDSGYKVYGESETKQIVIGYMDEKWVIQSAGRITEEGKEEKYSVILQPIREFVNSLRTDDNMFEELAINQSYIPEE